MNSVRCFVFGVVFFFFCNLGAAGQFLYDWQSDMEEVWAIAQTTGADTIVIKSPEETVLKIINTDFKHRKITQSDPMYKEALIRSCPTCKVADSDEYFFDINGKLVKRVYKTDEEYNATVWQFKYNAGGKLLQHYCGGVEMDSSNLARVADGTPIETVWQSFNAQLDTFCYDEHNNLVSGSFFEQNSGTDAWQLYDKSYYKNTLNGNIKLVDINDSMGVHRAFITTETDSSGALLSERYDENYEKNKITHLKFFIRVASDSGYCMVSREILGHPDSVADCINADFCTEIKKYYSHSGILLRKVTDINKKTPPTSLSTRDFPPRTLTRREYVYEYRKRP